MYIDIFNLLVLLAIFFSGALVFFLGFYCANKITIKDNDDIVVEIPKISKVNKEVKSSLKVKTKKEEQEDEKEHTVFFG